jgi:hypothetical protein
MPSLNCADYRFGAPNLRDKHLLPGETSDSGVTAKDNRLFVEAVLWIARTG